MLYTKKLQLLTALGILVTLVQGYRIIMRHKKIPTKYGRGTIQLENKPIRALVVYYSLSGNTRVVAESIGRKINADLYEIRTQRKYNFVSALLSKLQKHEQIDLNISDLPNLSSYDVIFIGSPVWAGSIPTPLLSFLRTVDLDGKKIAPYSTHRGGVGKFHAVLRENAKNAKILRTIDFYRAKKIDDISLENMITDWLNNLETAE
ncbi:MAG: hypothetical protein LBB24_02940 [Rickettsiales bacterium]|jgi:flavodoxin|nr:hypothetical protein [Rickettsiales bacterium]